MNYLAEEGAERTIDDWGRDVSGWVGTGGKELKRALAEVGDLHLGGVPKSFCSCVWKGGWVGKWVGWWVVGGQDIGRSRRFASQWRAAALREEGGWVGGCGEEKEEEEKEKERLIH